MKTLQITIVLVVLFSLSVWVGSLISTYPADAAPAAPGQAQVIHAERFPSLQAALDAVPAAGGIVKLPPGRFKLTQSLVLARENTRIEGAGPATHIINACQNGEPALIIRPKARAKKPRAKIWRVQLGNFRVSGNPKSGDGIRAEGVNEIYIHGVSVDHNGGHGISLIDCYEDPRVVNSLMTYNAQAGLNILAGHDIVVSANQFEENQDALRCIDSFNLCMTGNNLDDHLRHGVVIKNTYGSVLSGNMIEECKGTAVNIDDNCYGITVSANVIAHNFSGGVILRDAWGCAVSANTFTIVASRAVLVGPESGRITISGNNFSNSHIGGKVKREHAATGVILQGTQDITISGNTFTGLAGSAVAADKECRRLMISGNALADLGRGSKTPVQPFELGGAREVVIGKNCIAK